MATTTAALVREQGRGERANLSILSGSHLFMTRRFFVSGHSFTRDFCTRVTVGAGQPPRDNRPRRKFDERGSQRVSNARGCSDERKLFESESKLRIIAELKDAS